MAALMSTGRFCLRCLSVQVTQTRSRRQSMNLLQRNIRPHKPVERRVFDVITQPIYIEEPIPMAVKCAQRKQKQLEEKLEVNPYEEFVFKQCQKMVWGYDIIIVCQALPISAKLYGKRKLKLNKSELRIYRYSNHLMRRAVEGTKLENMLPWFQGTNAYIVGEGNKLAELMKLLRRMPEFKPLGGLVDNRLLSRQELEWASKLPNIETIRGELVSILNQAAGEKTYRLLGSHQQTLSTNLEQLVKQNQGDQSSESKDVQEKNS